MKTICAATLILTVIGAAGLRADDKATSLTDARAAAEANLKTPEGEAYDQKLGKEFMEKDLATMKQCKESAGNAA